KETVAPTVTDSRSSSRTSTCRRVDGPDRLPSFQPRHRRFLEEDTRAAGLLGVGVVEHGAERLLVELDGARTGPAADSPARIIELDRMLQVPGLAVVARDDELNL